MASMLALIAQSEVIQSFEVAKEMGPYGVILGMFAFLWFKVFKPMRDEDRADRTAERNQWITILAKFEHTMNTALSRLSDEVAQTRREVHDLRGNRRNQDEVPAYRHDVTDDGN
jgi:hypothetical protein